MQTKQKQSAIPQPSPLNPDKDLSLAPEAIGKEIYQQNWAILWE
jgi:hypothetical protein